MATALCTGYRSDDPREISPSALFGYRLMVADLLLPRSKFAACAVPADRGHRIGCSLNCARCDAVSLSGRVIWEFADRIHIGFARLASATPFSALGRVLRHGADSDREPVRVDRKRLEPQRRHDARRCRRRHHRDFACVHGPSGSPARLGRPARQHLVHGSPCGRSRRASATSCNDSWRSLRLIENGSAPRCAPRWRLAPSISPTRGSTLPEATSGRDRSDFGVRGKSRSHAI